MTNLLVLLIVVLLIGFAVSFILRRRRSLVAQRGMSIGADLRTLSEQPRVRVREATMTGPDSVRLLLTPESGGGDSVSPEPGGGDSGGPEPELAAGSDLHFVVALHPEDSEYELLREWERSGDVLAIVIPPGSHLVRLRSIDSLQPLTLHRIDQD